MAGKQYKVLTDKGNRFTGTFNPQNLEKTLNSHAADGWHVVGSAWKSMSAQFVVILERDAQ